MKKNSNTDRRLRGIPLLLGGYGAFLGFGLIVIGLRGIREGVGVVRLLLGLAMAGFGLLGIWDGVRDLVRPDKRKKQEAASQFILTDTAGNRSSLVTPEILREQTALLAGSGEAGHFELRLLPPLPVEGYGLLKGILCMKYEGLLLAAYFEEAEEGNRLCQKSMETDAAAAWLAELLMGKPDFSTWERVEAANGPEGTASGLREQPADWHQLLIIFGENWHDEHKFFSARDVELAAEGIHEGKYLKAVLELGTQAIELFPGVQDGLLVLWRTDNTPGGETRFLAKTGTVTQVKFWLVNYLYHGLLGEPGGWTDVTRQMEKEMRKGGKPHG